MSDKAVDLIRLIYRSKSTGSAESQLNNILATARARNQRDHISGVLLYGKETFLQVLEGKPENVHALYQDIIRDKRHTDIKIILEDRIENRLFENWSMAYVALINEAISPPDGSLRLRRKEDVTRLLADPTHYIGGFLASVVDDLRQQNQDGL